MTQQKTCFMTEEQIVDLLLESSARVQERRRFERHAAECPACAERLREWASLLAAQPREESTLPSPAVWVRLKRALRWRAPLRQLLRLPQRTGRVAFAAGMAAVLFAVLYIGALSGIRDRLNSSAAVGPVVRADDEIISHMDMLLKNRTAQYPVQPLGTDGARGVAWVNDEAEELLLLVEGLPNVPGENYRVWSIHDGSRVTLGTMRLAAGKAHLHYRGSELHEARTISVSREQAGSGGAFAAPDVAAVTLK
ncbi:hypothetical protein SD70_01265 [Gordoniibacillus kamchatkensis]|uniref:Regulator of SigK n=1 Tax=Gordoniibacillus kamchatkensis TaxID=1590651 RepID=A0ABR5AN27_9BACL|nr:anti-sigma factor [Paenibacillus sp. VKM B-2647]KIL42213.1 hypothetical protein SD70_01265 [Paenibacillus sp. VKM B-2647]